ncbi:glycerate kinase [Epargyreus clarus]|uniref:glycerate kinase n=1 Tax=Epargyreus clarus TaxID=520877 RepID=UPI003C2BCC6A
MSKSLVFDLLQIFKSSVHAVLPENFVRKYLKYCEVSQQLTVAGKQFNLIKKNVYVVGTGKAVQNMAIEVDKILGSKIKSGIISIPVGSVVSKLTNKNIKFYEGAKNNLPDNSAVGTASKIKELVTSLKIDDLLLVLISGGGSALLSLPKAPITLQEKTDLIKRLANSGADIKELNTVRKRLSDLKGGQLAIKAYPAQVVSLILSDIVGDPLHLIASGPTTEDEDDSMEAMTIIKKYEVPITKPIEFLLTNPPDYYKRFPKDNVYNFLIGSNKLSTEAAFSESKSLEYEPIILSNSITGNVKDVAEKYVEMTKHFCKFLQGNINLDGLKNGVDNLKITGIHSTVLDNISMNTNNLCLILGGEITVEVKGTGKGGRNQQLALEFSKLLHNIKDDFKKFEIYLLSAGTDGIDGPTDAAGAIGYKDLIADADKENLDVDTYLNNNDSYNFYKSFKNGELHVITGHTNTNVMDIHLIIIRHEN